MNSKTQAVLAPRTTVLLPIIYLIHLAEEWFGGFLAWAPIALGYEISVERFILINATSLALFSIGTAAALHYTRMSWFATTLAALLGLNGLLHILATFGFGYYSPGTVTGFLLYIPIGIKVLRSTSSQFSRFTFRIAVLLGILLHGLVAYLAFI
ncbi:MAG: HXXEE domain-containing protein [Cyclobacteriaceae bacterium]